MLRDSIHFLWVNSLPLLFAPVIGLLFTVTQLRLMDVVVFSLKIMDKTEKKRENKYGKTKWGKTLAKPATPLLLLL